MTKRAGGLQVILSDQIWLVSPQLASPTPEVFLVHLWNMCELMEWAHPTASSSSLHPTRSHPLSPSYPPLSLGQGARRHSRSQHILQLLAAPPHHRPHSVRSPALSCSHVSKHLPGFGGAAPWRWFHRSFGLAPGLRFGTRCAGCIFSAGFKVEESPETMWRPGVSTGGYIGGKHGLQ